MRILWVKAGKLLPVDTGGKIRSYNLLRQLSARHSLTLLSYYGGARDEAYERELEEHLPGAESINTSAPETTLGQASHYLSRLFKSAPYAVTKFTSPSVARRIKGWMDERRFDVMVCDFLSASLNFPRALRTPSVLFQHNVESALWQRQAQHEPNLIKRAAFKIEALKMAAYERAAVKRFQHIIAVSEHDRALMSEMTDASRISVVPTGVDLSLYRAGANSTMSELAATNEAASAPLKERAPLVVFLGSMDWEANVDGVDYFCRDIWPAVLRSVPDARFRIVGRNPHARVRRLASASVEVTGTVPSVVDHLREAAVFVVPLRVGGGTRLKIFEAMATGKAVVSTTIGAEGLEVEHGRDILLADDAETFSDSIIMLLRDEALRRGFETAAARLAAQHDWSVVIKRFEEALERATQHEDVAQGVNSPLASVKA
ncbi:MAG: polysaccharide biosynthesis protein PslH [Blastocatellia bacterium]|jgi:glycosyltransferase involved in cell wall biosynthesis|nr:polysaccharide biosynthesis protein PslH [Blastocatellia bacterium]